MDIKTWQTMLERRGYQVNIRQKGNSIEYDIPRRSAVEPVSRPAFQFSQLSYKGARREIDQALGYGMEHDMHECGYPLLKAPVGYTCDEPLSPIYIGEPLLHVQFYEVPLYTGTKPLVSCPQCGKPLSTKTVHRVKDPEASI